MDIYTPGSGQQAQQWTIIRIPFIYDNSANNDVFRAEIIRDANTVFNSIYFHHTDTTVEILVGSNSLGVYEPGTQFSLNLPSSYDVITVRFDVPRLTNFTGNLFFECWVSTGIIFYGAHEIIGPRVGVHNQDGSTPGVNDFLLNFFPGLAPVVAAIPTPLSDLGYVPQFSGDAPEIDDAHVPAVSIYSNPETVNTSASQALRGIQRINLSSFVCAFNRSSRPYFGSVAIAANSTARLISMWCDPAENKRIRIRRISLHVLGPVAPPTSMAIYALRITSIPTGGTPKGIGSIREDDVSIVTCTLLPTGGAATTGNNLFLWLQGANEVGDGDSRYLLWDDTICDGLAPLELLSTSAAPGLVLIADTNAAVTFDFLINVWWTEHSII